MNQERPSSEELLARIQSEETRRGRGKLKVFFGATAGVGKTFAMLEQAQARRREGVEVVVGWVETHGRLETEALLAGLERLPAREVAYRSAVLRDFDLDAALERKPTLLLLDELAHTNAPGARHAKRWQDAEEILAAGIDVYTTVNVQHLDSLNDVVARITGVVVRETVPDRILIEADEIELVDLTADDLLQRLRDGKVYVPTQAERALRGFFRKGNLIALRELALRWTAERVDAQMQTYKRDQGIPGVWPVAERILVCISASPNAAKVVRAAARTAAGIQAEWIVLHVEKPGRIGESSADQERVAEVFRLAERLGAQTARIIGEKVSEEILAFARTRNVTRIVVGKPMTSKWRDRVLGSVADSLIRNSDDMDVSVIQGATEDGPPATRARIRLHSPVRSYLLAIAVMAVATGLARLMFPSFSPPNLVMIYLLGVVFVAIVWGRGPAMLASLIGVVAFDFFYVPPHFSLTVEDSEYFVTFGVMLVVALSISSLAVRLRQQAESHRRREERTAALYRMSREFARSLTVEDVVKRAEYHLGEVFASEVWVLLPDGEGGLVQAPGITSTLPLDPKELEVARWAFAHGQAAGLGTETLSKAGAMYVPLVTSRGSVGVVGLFPMGGRPPRDPEQMHLLEAFADQTALVIERATLAREAQEAHVRAETERLRGLLLSSVSHDLRTPLAAITGAASSLLEGENSLDHATRRELAESIVDEAERLSRMVSNLLNMMRIESGAIAVHKDWQPIEEVVGATLNHMERHLRNRPVRLEIPDGLPLVPLDGILIEQVLMNLVENALKYTPAESPIEISARSEEGGVQVEVADRGPGLPEGAGERVFEKFYRARPSQDRSGFGLGLSICRGIVEAHGGRIWADSRPGGGTAFRFFLPIEGTPPKVEPVDAKT